MSIESEMLAAVIPDDLLRKRVGKASDDLVRKVREAAACFPIDLDVRLVGSVAKDTFVGDPDIDVFIMFPEDTPRATLDEVGLSIGRKVVTGEERYAEHPYIHGIFEGYEVDLVPCFDLADALHIKSAVDRTPFHTEYVRSHLRPEQRDQVRLLKQFMKGIGVYGADAKVNGFSGYLAELLILRYGNFQGAVNATSAWTAGTALSLDGEGKDGFRSPLVFIDPVDRNRNVASAVSSDSFALYIHACAEYSRNPDSRFFFPSPVEPLQLVQIEERLERLGTKVVAVRTLRPELTDDNLYPQVQRTAEGLIGLLGQFGFVVIDHAYLVGDDISFIMMLENDQLSDCTLHLGPPVWVGNSEKFLERWRSEGEGLPFIRDGKWVVMARRENTSASDLLRRRFKEAALGSSFRKLDGIVVSDHEMALEPGSENVLSKMLDKRFPWER
jgi:tRNA nucleotidyltransferase (CCA-adding enzyme)